MRKALELEPFAPVLHVNLGMALMLGKHFAEAEQEFRNTLDMDPNFPFAHFSYAQVLILQKRFDEAVTELERTVQSIPESTYYRGYLGYAYARAGKTGQARTILGELVEEAKTNYVSWLGIADIYVGLGEKDHAFAALELAYQQGDPRMDGIRAHADADSYWTTDPRFAELLKKIGLPPLN
jgi:Tfp pilus assembly protein PilF